MTDARPDPLVPQEVDLRDFSFTPMYRARLFGSAFHAKANDAEWRAGVTLWLKSQDQVPAGSLPNDDVELCRLAELARDIKRWRKIRENALHGWFECNDGRLYNKVTAQIALEQWQSKIDQRSRTSKARIAALEKRLAQATEPHVKAEIEAQLQTLRQSIATSVTTPVTTSVTEPVTASKGQGQGQGQLRDRDNINSHGLAPVRGGEGLNGHANEFEAFWQTFPKRVDRKAAERAYTQAIERAPASTILAGARLYAESRRGQDPHYTKRPDNWLEADGWTEFGGRVVMLTPEQDEASRDKADHLLKRGKYAEQGG